jgi:hypothetical protein
MLDKETWLNKCIEYIYWMFCWQCITVYQYNETNVIHFYSVCYKLRASTCFEHYLLIFKRLFTNGTWYIACVLYQLAVQGLKQLEHVLYVLKHKITNTCTHFMSFICRILCTWVMNKILTFYDARFRFEQLAPSNCWILMIDDKVPHVRCLIHVDTLYIINLLHICL